MASKKKADLPLTDKQLRFCQIFASEGATILSAMIGAGYTEQYARTGGRGMENDPRIKAKIEELRKPLEKKFGVNREKQIERLEDVINDYEAKHSDRLKAIEIMNKMMGLNEPEKHEVSHSVLSDDLETTIAKAIRILKENGYKVEKK